MPALEESPLAQGDAKGSGELVHTPPSPGNATQSLYKPTVWTPPKGSPKYGDPPRPPTESLSDPVEIAGDLSCYHKGLPVAPLAEDPNVLALLEYKATLEKQYFQGLSNLLALEQNALRFENDPVGFMENIKTGLIKPKGEDGYAYMKQLQELDPAVHVPDLSEADIATFNFPGTAENPISTPHSNSDSGVSSAGSIADDPTIPELPTAPHIDWSRYWVCGESLEKLHQEILAGRIPKFTGQLENKAARNSP